jgi:hypothetical protein
MNRTPYDGGMIGRVVAWTAMTLPLSEDWPITVALMTTDWLDHHDEGGIAYPDRRGAFIYIPRETLDPWSYIVYVGGHEIRHLQQFEAKMPGCSLREPDFSADEPDERIAENAVREVRGSADIDPDLLRQAIEHAKKKREEIEADADRAGNERLRVWTDELAAFERDRVRFGQFEPLPYQWG